MINLIRQLLKPKYDTLNIIKIKADNILYNYNYLKNLQREAEIFPVLKSNAYGHGLKEICQILNRSSAKIAVVDSYPEAQVAYRYFKGKILILGEMPLKAYRYCLFKKTEFIVYNAETLKYLSRFGKKVFVHLFINSGMNREGIQDLSSFIKNNKRYLDRVTVNGLCSHFASADIDSILNETQSDNFSEALDILRSAGYFPKWVHLGNSASVFKSSNKFLTAYRPGISLYGYSPFEGGEREVFLRPALQVYSKIVSVQNLRANESVSYNESYRAPNDTKIAVIPFGYFEGLDRRLSNRAQFLVLAGANKFWAPIAGRVCMNLCCLDVRDQLVKIGDEVQIVSDNPTDLNSVEAISRLIGTISYEFLAKLQANIRREII